ncbi:hypothetical protein [Streptomyces sp. NPDC088400]|uniref:hypothetical protein n=1 Tax=Streptomyces sp. NPDC088400 TaxID=3365861 RepID=UPI0038210F69
MRERATDTRTYDPEELTALASLVAADGFWRLAPEWVPLQFAVPTRELMERVERGLRRLAA